MKQLIQHLRTGVTEIIEVPAPAITAGHILVRSACSVISTGTEKMLVEFSKANIISKARQNPDRVAQVLDKIKTDGLIPTLEAVFNKLDEPLPLGYSNAGVVIGVAPDVSAFKIGDRVVTNGTHAEINAVPIHLAARIPDAVDDETAAFTVIASVGMQAVRLADPEIGDTTFVIGLGLVGLLTCQLLQAQGARVIAYDINEEKNKVARSLGIQTITGQTQEIIRLVFHSTRELGADQVIICASAHDDNLINMAAQAARKRGRIVLTGVVNMTLDRGLFYQKELTFQVSGSYGPGRYDPQYEQMGIDYPAPYVRYTVQRNFEAVLYAMSTGAVKTAPLITSKIMFTEAVHAYQHVGDRDMIATVITYKNDETPKRQISLHIAEAGKNHIVAGVIGAGNFSRMTMLPALKGKNIFIKYIAANNGLDATLLAKKFRIPHATTDIDIVLRDPEVNLVLIATRHDSHAEIAIKALEAGKHVFVEKPIALNNASLQMLASGYTHTRNQLFFTGFNRRHAPLAVQAKSHILQPDDLNMLMTINAGSLPAGHWLNDPLIGGGRIIGEACHFFDLMQYFADSDIATVYATDNSKHNTHEHTIIHLTCANGAQGSIAYVANGSKAFPKEQVTLFTGGKVISIDNFRKLTVFGHRGTTTASSRQDKGHAAQFHHMLDALLHGKPACTSFATLENITKATFAAIESIQTGQRITL